jgi:hypothetical protein
MFRNEPSWVTMGARRGTMRAFYCDRCGSLVFFENFQCVKCDARLGFAADAFDLLALENDGEVWVPVAEANRHRRYRRCANDLQHAVCNWLIADDDKNELCASCRRNDVIPDLTVGENLRLWAKIEIAKRRAIYNLIELHLFTEFSEKLRFKFMSGDTVVTGHAAGLITLNVAEADDVERERRRVSFREPYRTLLGHFRHEIGHFYWKRMVADTSAHERFRTLFGDETRNYADALKNYYANGAPADWQINYISAYATAHPWEDWAETWAHYLHMIDTLETAASFGMSLKPKHPDAKAMSAEPRTVDVVESPFDRILRHWLPLTYALNSLNRGMGLPDLYPFVLSTPIIEKLRFVHDVIVAVK